MTITSEPEVISEERLRVRITGAVAELSGADQTLLFERGTSADPVIRDRVAAIIARVRRDGDRALRALAHELDGARLETPEVPRAACRRALDETEPRLRRAMERTRDNIRTAHRSWMPNATDVETEPGVVVGRRPDPLSRVGVYAPGGRAAYPSSVLMGAVPARVAGVEEVILCTPPNDTGAPAAAVLAAAELAGVDRVFAIGGAGAIAAMAYGTESVPRVDRIVGPGNAYVAEAKLQVSAVVGIDSPAGPSELLVIADDGCDPGRVALELLAQAEHDPFACVVAVTLGAGLQVAVLDALRHALSRQPRRDVIARALESRGAVLRASSLREAIEFANRYAPEHLLLAVRDAQALLGDVRNAGTVFLSDSSSVPFGDYMTGANHVLPTGAMARTYSGLSVLDFMRWTTYQQVTPAAAARLAGDVALFAESEGLPTHAAAARTWDEVASPDAAERVALGGDASAQSRTLALSHSRVPALSHSRPLPPRAAYRRISLYAPDRAPCAVDLSDNTNLWGVPPAAAAAVRDAAVPSITRYPPLYAAELKQELAAYAGVTPEEIVTGCGSDDVLDSALRAFAEPGERVAYPDPSFAMVPLFARMNGLEGIAVPLTAALDIDAGALLATGARVIYVCSPNNPTGTLASRDALDELIAGAPGVVILDEAYAEFAGDAAPRAAVRDRLLVVRTMSKAFGLAGLRIGYAVGPSDLAAEVEKSRGPYKVSSVAERAALAALRHDTTWVREHVAEVQENRARLAEVLAALGLAPLPSAANFLLVPVRGAAALTARMRAAGVAVRPFTSLPGIGDAVRITIGPWPMMQAALAALQECASLTTTGEEAR